jgi:putative membrane protein
MSSTPRQPQAFVLDEDDEIVRSAKTAKARVPKADIVFEPEPIQQDIVLVPETSTPPQRRFGWLGLLLSALTALIVMWAGLSITELVESFFARNSWLGWFALGLAAVASLATVAIILREVFGLLRLNAMAGLQERSARAINLDEKSSADAAISEITSLYQARPDMAYALQKFNAHKSDILDPRDRMRLAERHLVTPLDEEARRIIARRARRVTLLTTVTPAAVLDMLFVAAQNLAMLREIATLYGGKPSSIATLKLARMVLTHLAVSGGLALSDNILQHVVGKGLLGRLSARFGEGAVNGILTSRIGLAAINVCRPIPSSSTGSQNLASLLKEVLSFSDKGKDDADTKRQ